MKRSFAKDLLLTNLIMAGYVVGKWHGTDQWYHTSLLTDVTCCVITALLTLFIWLWERRRAA